MKNKLTQKKTSEEVTLYNNDLYLNYRKKFVKFLLGDKRPEATMNSEIKTH